MSEVLGMSRNAGRLGRRGEIRGGKRWPEASEEETLAKRRCVFGKSACPFPIRAEGPDIECYGDRFDPVCVREFYIPGRKKTA